jgi:alpha-galactosidase/6-phospho-beta-glucosidase family protein
MKFNKAELRLLETGLNHLWWYYRNRQQQDQFVTSELIKIEKLLAKIAP